LLNVSAVGAAFVAAFGRPDPPTPAGFDFYQFRSLYAEVGAGWFRDGFLYLFGPGLQELTACLRAWPFLVPPCPDRLVLGRNAYGALLVLSHAHDPELEQVELLDPVTVTFAAVPHTVFRNLIGRALPDGELPGFLDDRAYRRWLAAHGVDRLDLDEVLGIGVPVPLGGELAPANLQLDDLAGYYRSTGPIYAPVFTAPPAPACRTCAAAPAT
jgi:hypothetical protein